MLYRARVAVNSWMLNLSVHHVTRRLWNISVCMPKYTTQTDQASLAVRNRIIYLIPGYPTAEVSARRVKCLSCFVSSTGANAGWTRNGTGFARRLTSCLDTSFLSQEDRICMTQTIKKHSSRVVIQKACGDIRKMITCQDNRD